MNRTNRSMLAVSALCACGLGCHDLSYSAPCDQDPSVSPECPGYVADAMDASGSEDTAVDASLESSVDALDSDSALSDDAAPDAAPDVPPSCSAAGPATQSCGKCGTQSRTCVSAGTYGPWETCGGEGACAPGDVQPATGPCAGALEKATQTCKSDCSWGVPACALPKGWTKIADPPAGFAGRSQAAVAWSGKELIVWGGTVDAGLASDGAAYDPVKNTWRLLAPAPTGFAGREQPVATWSGGSLIVWGGSNSGTGLSDGAMYYPSSDSWVSMSASPLSARDGAGGVWSPTVAKLVVWGGATNGVDQANGAIYSPGGDSWTMMPSGPLVARNTHLVVWNGSEVVIWGGRQGDKDFQRDGARFDPSAKSWASLPPIPSAWADRFPSPWSAINGGFGVFGGVQISPGFPLFGDSLVLSGTGVWSLIAAPTDASVTPAAHVMGTSWSNGARAWAWGGTSDLVAGTPTNTGIVLDVASAKWSAMPGISPLSARSLASSVWTGSFAIVWGGQSAAKLRDGAIYVP